MHGLSGRFTLGDMACCMPFVSFFSPSLFSLFYLLHTRIYTEKKRKSRLIPTPVPLQISRDRPIGRCPNCGNVLKMNYVGPPTDPNEHHEGHYEEPKTFADYVRPEYW